MTSSSVHPGEGSSSVALLKGSSLFSPVKGYFFPFFGSFSWSDVRSKVRDVVSVQIVKPSEANSYFIHPDITNWAIFKKRNCFLYFDLSLSDTYWPLNPLKQWINPAWQPALCNYVTSFSNNCLLIAASCNTRHFFRDMKENTTRSCSWAVGYTTQTVARLICV